MPVQNNVSDKTFPDIRSVLRVFEKGPRHLSDSDSRQCLLQLEQGLTGDLDLPTMSAIVQALILSNKSQDTAELIFRVCIDRHHDLPSPRLTQILQLVFILFLDRINSGSSRSLAGASQLLSLIEKRIANSDTPARPSLVRGMVFPFLKCDAQSSAIRIVREQFSALDASYADFSAITPLLLDVPTEHNPPVAFDEIEALIRDQRAFCDQRAELVDPRQIPQEQVGDWFKLLAFSGRFKQLGQELVGRCPSKDSGLDVVNCHLRLINSVASNSDRECKDQIRGQFEDLFSRDACDTALALATHFGDFNRGHAWLEFRTQNNPPPLLRFYEALFLQRFGKFSDCVKAASLPLSVFAQVAQNRVSGHASPGAYPTILAHPRRLYSLCKVALNAKYVDDIDTFVGKVRGGAGPRSSNQQVICYSGGGTFAAQLPYAAIESARTSGCYVAYPDLSESRSEWVDPTAKSIWQDLRNVAQPYCPHVNAHAHEFAHRWTIDLEKNWIGYERANYFHLIRNTLGINFRRYSLDLSSPSIAADLVQLQNRLGYLHDAFISFGAKAVKSDNDYAFLVVGIQFGIANAIRRMVDHLKLPNVRVLHACNGFEAFDPNHKISADTSNLTASFHAIADLTGNPDVPLGFRPSRTDVAQMGDPSQADTQSATVSKYLAKIDQAGSMRWTQRAVQKFSGRQVLLLGTILPDLSIPEDSGAVHHDIADWLSHSIEIARRHQNLHLNIKLHPAERNEAIAYYVSETFLDLVDQQNGLPDNVTVLPVDSRLGAEAGKADLTVLWSGTSALDLAIMRRPYVCASRNAIEEYPIPSASLRSRDHYEALLTGLEKTAVDPAARPGAIRLIEAISSSPVREKMSAFERQLTNGQIRQPQVDIAGAVAECKSPQAKRLAALILRHSKTP